ncbi:hypothetical protein [Micromonospora pisi]|uniref:hypothetical protein n=1 Tax=Micromonospora pisi TaxID=589240 RepID=UPI001B85E47D|nr:hypothetical protein [Micromonospora pisi]
MGLLLAADGIGTLIGAALPTRFTRWIGSARALIVAGFVAAAGAVVVPWGAGGFAYVMFVVGNVVFSAGVVVPSVVTRTYRQVASPPELLSRVMATVRFVSWGAVPVGGVVAGARHVVGLCGVLVGAPVVLVLSPVCRLRDLTDFRVADRDGEAVAVGG